MSCRWAGCWGRALPNVPTLNIAATHTIIYGMFIDSIYDMPKITVLFNNTNPLSIYGIYGIYGMYPNTIYYPP